MTSLVDGAVILSSLWYRLLLAAGMQNRYSTILFPYARMTETIAEGPDSTERSRKGTNALALCREGKSDLDLRHKNQVLKVLAQGTQDGVLLQAK